MIKKFLVGIFLLACVVSSGYDQELIFSYTQEPEIEPVSRVYKTASGVNLHLHIFVDKDSEEKPSFNKLAIVLFHGGGWSKGNWTQFIEYAKELIKHGIVVICVEYRLMWVHGITPYECVEDARSAIRWVRANSCEFGIDIGKIIAAGGSAGGHLALCTALLDDPNGDFLVSSKPNGLIIFNGVFNTHPEDGWGGDRIGVTWKDLSPYHQLRPEIPVPDTIIFHGDQDRITPVQNAKDFYEASKAMGNNCFLHIFKGQEHGFYNFDRGPNPKDLNSIFYQIMLETLVFLRRFDKGSSIQAQNTSNIMIFDSIYDKHEK